MAKGEDLQKPKKSGMVIVIGVGAKPKKKGDIKKYLTSPCYSCGATDPNASCPTAPPNQPHTVGQCGAYVQSQNTGIAKAEEGDAPRRQRRRRNRGGPRATLRRLYSRLRNEKARTGTNIDAFLEQRKIDPEEFYGEFRRRTGEDFDDYLKGGKDKFDVQKLLEELATKAFEERKAKAIERQSGAGKRKRTQENIYYGLLNTPVNLLERKGIDPDRFRRAVQRMKDKGEKVDKNTFSMLINRFSDEDAARDYKELPDEAFRLAPRGPDKRDHEEVEDHEYRTMRRILSVLREQYGEEAVVAMARRYATQGYTGAPVGHEGEIRKPKRGVSVSHLPSTIFHDEFAPADSRMSSPQEEEYEGVTFDPRSRGIQGGARQHQEFIMRALSPETINVMDEAFALLKGNPAMRDAQGRAINHPAAMVYDDLAHQIHMTEQNPFDAVDEDDESASHVMEQMQKPTHQKKVMQRMKRGKPMTYLDARMATRNDEAEKNRLNRYRKFARERTSQIMDEPDQTAGPNFGIQQSTGTDVRMKQGNIMDRM